jgi:hypothetical protein
MAMDQFPKECLVTHADQHIKSEQIVNLMRALCACHAILKRLQIGNSRKFISKTLDHFSYEN